MFERTNRISTFTHDFVIDIGLYNVIFNHCSILQIFRVFSNQSNQLRKFDVHSIVFYWGSLSTINLQFPLCYVLDPGFRTFLLTGGNGEVNLLKHLLKMSCEKNSQKNPPSLFYRIYQYKLSLPIHKSKRPLCNVISLLDEDYFKRLPQILTFYLCHYKIIKIKNLKIK